MSNFLFTSESVSEGHPDKIADQISDAILDAIITDDKYSRVACETMVSNGMIAIGGEITTNADINYERIIRDTILDIGYDDERIGINGHTCEIINRLGKQSVDIARGVDQDKNIGAGDQGLVFGYACNETEELMPAPILYAHHLMKQQATVRKSSKLSWLRPDAKAQISMVYENNKPVAIDTIVLSTQHDEEVSQDTLRQAVMDEIIKPVIPSQWLNNTKFHINPTGRFVIGGPEGDCGLTGRKIIVDTYGGMARHGGGCFSGKDPSKVDRSAAYAGRYVAKNIVAAGLATHCEVQICYAIGVAEPVAIHIETFGSCKISEAELIKLVRQHFDLTPRGIIESLDLLRPIYKATASYGHFGRNEPDFSWEKTDKAEALKADANCESTH